MLSEGKKENEHGKKGDKADGQDILKSIINSDSKVERNGYLVWLYLIARQDDKANDIVLYSSWNQWMKRINLTFLCSLQEDVNNALVMTSKMTMHHKISCLKE